MNRVMRSSVVLAAAIGMFACKGDPTDSLRNGVDHLIASPSSLWLTFGGTDSIQTVLVEAVDAQGNRVEATFPQSVTAGAGITVTRDTLYNPVYSGSNTPGQPSHTTRAQYIVQAVVAAANSSFDIQVGGKSLTIPVRVQPSALPVTFSPAAPNPSDTVTMTVGAGFKLLPNADITIAGTNPFILGIAADSSSISFIPLPGTAPGINLVVGVALDFLTQVPLTLPTATDLTSPAPYNATSFATAPVLTLPPTGQTSTYVDGGDFAPVTECLNDLGGNCRIYSFVVAASTSLTFTATWEGTTDLGLYFYDSGLNVLGSFGCDSGGNGATGQPETCTHTFAPGTYYFASDDFGPFYSPAEAAPVWTRYDITTN